MEKSGYFKSVTNGDNGHDLFYSLFTPDEQPILGTVLILHGMQEHSGRYKDFATFLCNSGFAVLTYDHLGHGLTAKNKDDHGFFVSNHADVQVVDDAEKMMLFLEHKFPGTPHFLLGHSMGSFVARCLLQRVSDRFKGAAIVGTGGKIAGIGFGKALITFLDWISPRYRNALINNGFNKLNNKRFKGEDNTLGTNWLSVNIENQKAFINDELCGIPFTHNGFKTLLALNMQATKRSWAENIALDCPLLFVSGADDPIGDFGKGVMQTVDDLKTDGFTEVSVKLYPNKRHELLNETGKEEAYTDINNWLKERLH